MFTIGSEQTRRRGVSLLCARWTCRDTVLHIASSSWTIGGGPRSTKQICQVVCRVRPEGEHMAALPCCLLTDVLFLTTHRRTHGRRIFGSGERSERCGAERHPRRTQRHRRAATNIPGDRRGRGQKRCEEPRLRIGSAAPAPVSPPPPRPSPAPSPPYVRRLRSWPAAARA